MGKSVAFTTTLLSPFWLKFRDYVKINDMKRRIRRPFLNVVKIVMIGVLVTLIVIIGVFIWNQMTRKNEPVIVNEETTYDFSLFDYVYYKPEGLDFGFIVADINVSSNHALNIGLDKLSSSEGVTLSQTDEYLTKLAEANYKPGTQALSFSINTTEKNLRLNLFIPVLNLDLESLTVQSDFEPKSTLTFNLLDSSKFASDTLIKIDTNVSTLEKDLNFTINYVDLFDSSNFYSLDASGQPLTIEFSSQERVYGISIDVSNSSQNNYKLKNARLIIDDFGEYGLLNPDILLPSTINLTKQTLIKDVSGYVFFTLPDDQIKLLSYDKTKVHLALEFVSGESVIIPEILK